MAKPMPIVAAALVCEKVLREKDEVLSVIRIFDTLKTRLVGVSADGKHVDVPADSPVDISRLTMLLALKAGDALGTHEVRLRFRMPDGKTVEGPQRFSVVFAARSAATNIVAEILLPTKQFGPYVIEVLWDGDLLTTIPFKVEASEVAPQTPASP